MRQALALFVAAVVLAGCALRPRYADFFDKQTTAPARLQVLEKKTGMPVAGASIEVGEARSKLSLKTDAEGFFTLPVDKRLLEDNALIVVSAPAGVGATQVVATSPPASSAPAPEPAPVSVAAQPSPEAAVEGPDAGS